MARAKQIKELYNVLGISINSFCWQYTWTYCNKPQNLNCHEVTSLKNHRYMYIHTSTSYRKMVSQTCSSVPVTLYLQYVFQIATLKASRPTGSSLFNPAQKEKAGENSLQKHWVQCKFMFIQQFSKVKGQRSVTQI